MLLKHQYLQSFRIFRYFFWRSFSICRPIAKATTICMCGKFLSAIRECVLRKWCLWCYSFCRLWLCTILPNSKEGRRNLHSIWLFICSLHSTKLHKKKTFYISYNPQNPIKSTYIKTQKVIWNLNYVHMYLFSDWKLKCPILKFEKH